MGAAAFKIEYLGVGGKVPICSLCNGTGFSETPRSHAPETPPVVASVGVCHTALTLPLAERDDRGLVAAPEELTRGGLLRGESEVGDPHYTTNLNSMPA